MNQCLKCQEFTPVIGVFYCYTWLLSSFQCLNCKDWWDICTLKRLSTLRIVLCCVILLLFAQQRMRFSCWFMAPCHTSFLHLNGLTPWNWSAGTLVRCRGRNPPQNANAVTFVGKMRPWYFLILKQLWIAWITFNYIVKAYPITI